MLQGQPEKQVPHAIRFPNIGTHIFPVGYIVPVHQAKNAAQMINVLDLVDLDSKQK